MELKAFYTDDSYTHLTLTGKMDIAGVKEIADKFSRLAVERKRNVIVEMSGVTFLGSMGLRILLSAAKSLKQEKKKLILLNPQPLVNEVLEASGIGDVVAIEHDTASAVAQAQA